MSQDQTPGTTEEKSPDVKTKKLSKAPQLPKGRVRLCNGLILSKAAIDCVRERLGELVCYDDPNKIIINDLWNLCHQEKDSVKVTERSINYLNRNGLIDRARGSSFVTISATTLNILKCALYKSADGRVMAINPHHTSQDLQLASPDESIKTNNETNEQRKVSIVFRTDSHLARFGSCPYFGSFYNPPRP